MGQRGGSDEVLKVQKTPDLGCQGYAEILPLERAA
jgi:hypothetical protein